LDKLEKHETAWDPAVSGPVRTLVFRPCPPLPCCHPQSPSPIASCGYKRSTPPMELFLSSSPPCTTSTLFLLSAHRLCSPASATTAHLRPSPPLHLGPTPSESRRLSPPARALLRPPLLPRQAHRRQLPFMHPRPHHRFKQDHMTS
jgi:hypothetical protein